MPDISLEDLKARKEKGILTDRYVIDLRVPVTYISNPVEGQGISYLSVAKVLQELILSAQYTRVKRLNKKTAVLELTVAEPYLRILHRELSKVESAVLIKGENNE